MVLLAPATVSAEQEDGATTIATLQVEEEVGSRADDHGNNWCDIKCDYQQDPVKRQFCVDQCHSQEHHHPSREFCEMKCQHWQDPTRKEQCVQQCMSFGLNLHVGNNNGVDGRPHALEEEVGSRADDHGNDDCDIKCAYYQDLARRQFCVDQCHSQQHHHPSREDCELKCQHWQDPTRKEQCVQQCMSFGLNLHVGGSSSVDEHLRGWEVVAGAIIEEVVSGPALGFQRPQGGLHQWAQ
ncbi:antimicrobial peptides-like [Triticum dicoccoides]|uniref:antimicrobial peptides-like n=1 Tax=Triticum dicoccoides TaxID=85692 RepID=UPI00188FA227|nr:antimicrobial peptides-like [Triticum dicoccoides]